MKHITFTAPTTNDLAALAATPRKQPLSLLILDELSDKIKTYSHLEHMAEEVFCRQLIVNAIQAYETTGVI